MGIGKALSKGMGLIPALASGAMGEKNKGFALGIIPGMLYKQNAKEDEAEERARMEAEAQGKQMPTEIVRANTGGKVKTDFPDQSAEARKKRMEMPADKYGKMVDKTMGVSKGGKKGDFNEEPDTAPVKKYAPGGSVSSASKRADGCCVKGKTKGRMV
jgi:hypothetical protein